jgi:hypothetical protein
MLHCLTQQKGRILNMEATKQETKKRWRDIYKVHPAADLFPMLPEDELRNKEERAARTGYYLFAGRRGRRSP